MKTDLSLQRGRKRDTDRPNNNYVNWMGRRGRLEWILPLLEHKRGQRAMNSRYVVHPNGSQEGIKQSEVRRWAGRLVIPHLRWHSQLAFRWTLLSQMRDFKIRSQDNHFQPSISLIYIIHMHRVKCVHFGYFLKSNSLIHKALGVSPYKMLINYKVKI